MSYVERIESVRVNQGVLARMLNYGPVIFSGAGMPQASIRSIADPLALRKAALGAQEAKR